MITDKVKEFNLINFLHFTFAQIEGKKDKNKMHTSNKHINNNNNIHLSH